MTLMTILAIDYGQKRIGLAISDPAHRVALPLRVLANKPLWLTALAQIIREKEVTGIVLGWPRPPAGKPDAMLPKLETLKRNLESRLSVPVDLFNEAWTTRKALSQQRAAGIKQKKGRAHVDALAARNLLEKYLNALENSPPA
jgi:putative Holliday junction resolvase